MNALLDVLGGPDGIELVDKLVDRAHGRDRAAGTVPLGGGDGVGVGDHPGRAVPGVAGALPQPGGGDHRRRVRRADRGDLRVQPTHPGVPERGALLGGAVDPVDGVVDVDQAPLVDPGQQVRPPGQPAGPARRPRPAAARARRRMSAGTCPGRTAPASWRTAPRSRRAAARPSRRSCPRPRPSPRPATSPWPRHSRRRRRAASAAAAPVHRSRPVRPVRPLGPGPPTRPGRARRTLLTSRNKRAKAAATRCSPRGECLLRNNHSHARPSTSASLPRLTQPRSFRPAETPAGAREATASSCCTCPKANARRNVPGADGARILAHSTPVAPAAARPSRRSCPRPRPSPRPATSPWPRHSRRRRRAASAAAAPVHRSRPFRPVRPLDQPPPTRPGWARRTLLTSRNKRAKAASTRCSPRDVTVCFAPTILTLRRAPRRLHHAPHGQDHLWIQGNALSSSDCSPRLGADCGRERRYQQVLMEPRGQVRHSPRSAAPRAG